MAESDDKRETMHRRGHERPEPGAETDGRSGTGEPVHVEDATHFSELVAANPLVLVDFYAAWCTPCKTLEPTVEALAGTTAAVVAKVDVDAEQLLASQYDISDVPTLLLFSDGEPVERVVGVRDEESLAALIADHAAA